MYLIFILILTYFITTFSFKKIHIIKGENPYNLTDIEIRFSRWIFDKNSEDNKLIWFAGKNDRATMCEYEKITMKYQN